MWKLFTLVLALGLVYFAATGFLLAANTTGISSHYQGKK